MPETEMGLFTSKKKKRQKKFEDEYDRAEDDQAAPPEMGSPERAEPRSPERPLMGSKRDDDDDDDNDKASANPLFSRGPAPQRGNRPLGRDVPVRQNVAERDVQEQPRAKNSTFGSRAGPADLKKLDPDFLSTLERSTPDPSAPPTKLTVALHSARDLDAMDKDFFTKKRWSDPRARAPRGDHRS